MQSGHPQTQPDVFERRVYFEVRVIIHPAAFTVIAGAPDAFSQQVEFISIQRGEGIHAAVVAAKDTRALELGGGNQLSGVLVGNRNLGSPPPMELRGVWLLNADQF